LAENEGAQKLINTLVETRKIIAQGNMSMQATPQIVKLVVGLPNEYITKTWLKKIPKKGAMH